MDNREFAADAQRLLEENILPFWSTVMVDNRRGGFYGRQDGNGTIVEDAPRGAILNARILWSFSAAYRVLRRREYLDIATRAHDYMLRHFIDKEYGGVFWSVDADGNPLDTKKQTYAIGFAIYGFSEYARATGDEQALRTAIDLYRQIEAHCYDPVNGGYHEAMTREWQPMGDMRLSDKDENCDKTMNTHLHVIEPYTNLYRVWRDGGLRQQILGLVDVFTDKLLNPSTGHLDLFFNAEWQGRRDLESFGHDIEASWLLDETAAVIGEEALTRRLAPIVKRIADASEEGLNSDGSLTGERWKADGHTTTERDWWVQCECVIGEMNMAMRTTGEESRAYMKRALDCYGYIKRCLVDWDNGEWFWSVSPDGTPNRRDDHAGFWKCPYHNTRMCLEIIERQNCVTTCKDCG
jgi:cellobiose epimerase